MLCMIFAIRKFRHYLTGISFSFLVDCPALWSLMAIPISKGRIGKWILELSCFEFQVEEKPANFLKAEGGYGNSDIGMISGTILKGDGKVEDMGSSSESLIKLLPKKKSKTGEGKGKKDKKQRQGMAEEEVEPLPLGSSVETALDEVDHEGWGRLWFDGASRDAGATAGAGVVLVGQDGKIWAQGQQRLVKATCNEAEYRALILGLQKSHDLGLKRLKIMGDSKLVTQQLRGSFACKAQNLKPLLEKARAHLSCFEKVEIVHVPRQYNRVADALASIALNLSIAVNCVITADGEASERDVRTGRKDQDIMTVSVEHPIPFCWKIARLIMFNEYPVDSTPEERKRLLRISKSYPMAPALEQTKGEDKFDLYKQGMDKI